MKQQRATPASRRGKLARRVAAILASVAIAVSASTAAFSPAFGKDYPSWDDVQAARSSEAAKQVEVDRITQLLEQLSARVAESQAVAAQRGEEYQAAQQQFDDANFTAQQLQDQATAAEALAETSKRRAGQLAARLARNGNDVSASLFFDGAGADDLLSQLGLASKITDQSAGVYEKATRDQNNAQALTDQANRAKDALKVLADAAAAALQAANEAADAAAAALQEQQDNEAQLQAQLAVLTENREATEADFQAGVEARAAAARAAEAARLAALAATTTHPVGVISNTGWVRPASGGISSPFGYRINPYSQVYAFHAGADIGAGCGQPIYAAHSGTVIMAGPNGGYGNFVQIANGDGVTTSYGHIVDGGIAVSRGSTVSAGSLIARVGSTGNSTGCHLHYEVRVGGTAIDPVPFMRDRGAAIG